MSRLGVFGGTFDPVHLGHLRAAEVAREQLELDAVAFVPAQRPPHRSAPLSSALDRYAMVALATAGHASFLPCDAEMRREGVSFTVDTLRQLRAEHPVSELVLIVGSDTLGELASWREREALFELCRIAVVSRPGQAGDTPAPPGARVERIRLEGLPISATEVRARVREGKSIRYLVTTAVGEYIDKRGLYR